MARVPGAEPIYEAADQFRQRCLVEGHSLLWPHHRVWTTANISSLWDAFIGHPDTGGRTFFEKWADQLADQPEAIHRVAADVIAFYHLFPSNVGPETKLTDVKRVVSWKLERDQPNFKLLEQAYSTHIGSPGTHYVIGRPWQVAFFLDFAREVLAQRVDLRDPTACKRVADEVRERVRESNEARHVLLHLLFPEQFERIASEPHKRQIFEAFRSDAAGAKDVDDALLNIRAALTKRQGREELDFYDEDIRRRWAPDLARSGGEQARCWIETTYVRGRPDREEGEYALGHALWSPQRDRRGADTYRFMREVQPGDIILHLTDRTAFSGISRAASPVQEFGGMPNTEWEMGPSYLVRLRDFVQLDPPLSREGFFASPHRERLLAFIQTGTRNLFYNRQLNLAQGAYLTPAPPELLAILNDAYRGLAGHTITQLVGREPPPAGILDELVEATNFTHAELEELESLLRQKKQIILEGPPGSGKTYVAELFGRYLSGNPLEGDHDERLVVIQFHQSYGYEDFVQGIRPETNDTGQLGYHVRDGIFKRLCDVAERNRDKDFAIIVDEINRGNISRIFGELLLLLEYRDKKARLPYAKPDDPPFSIPPNIYLIGTMNTTDRSLAQIDYALRRRFYFYRLRPVVNGTAPVLERWLQKRAVPQAAKERVLQLFINLNERVQHELGEHFQVGHSYFMDPDIGDDAVQRRVWERAVMPLLEEYFYNRRDRATLLDEFETESLLGGRGMSAREPEEL